MRAALASIHLRWGRLNLNLQMQNISTDFFWDNCGGASALAMSVLLSTFMFGLRGPYFAIGSLGIAVASAELTITINYVGGASGISMPLFPGDIEFQSTFFYILCFVLTIIAHFLLRWMYSTQFGLAINAIRDDEDKAEAMGIPTLVYKRIGWGVAAILHGGYWGGCW